MNLEDGGEKEKEKEKEEEKDKEKEREERVPVSDTFFYSVHDVIQSMM